MKRMLAILLVLFAAQALATPAFAASETRTIKPAFVSPPELARMLGVSETAGLGLLRWSADGADHFVTVRRNDSANLILLEGEPGDLDRVAAEAAIFDVAPRQIALEARVIEVNTDAARDLGVDWSQIRTNASVNWQGLYRSESRAMEQTSGGGSSSATDYADLSSGMTAAQLGASLADALHLLEQNGAATYKDAPRLLTLNNQAATVLDGHRVTYVERANGYANIYQTETMDAGLRLEVTPSLVESGYLRLDIEAELSVLVQVETNNYTGQGRDYAAISGSPVKRGQIIRNTVMAKDGETVVLAGFTRTVDAKARRSFPVLGSILPFLFSRDMSVQSHHESLIVITPHVVDLAGNVGARDKELIEGR